jgi:hypothetical protein
MSDRIDALGIQTWLARHAASAERPSPSRR